MPLLRPVSPVPERGNLNNHEPILDPSALSPIASIGRYQSGVESSCVSDLSDHGVTPVVGQTTSVWSSN